MVGDAGACGGRCRSRDPEPGLPPPPYSLSLTHTNTHTHKHTHTRAHTHKHKFLQPLPESVLYCLACLFFFYAREWELETLGDAGACDGRCRHRDSEPGVSSSPSIYFTFSLTLSLSFSLALFLFSFVYFFCLVLSLSYSHSLSPTLPRVSALDCSQLPNSKPRTPNPQFETPSPKPQTLIPRPQTPNPKSQTPNPKPPTPDSEPQILNPEPPIPNPKPQPQKNAQEEPLPYTSNQEKEVPLFNTAYLGFYESTKVNVNQAACQPSCRTHLHQLSVTLSVGTPLYPKEAKVGNTGIAQLGCLRGDSTKVWWDRCC